ncbi:MAG: mechanosensitive ion channel domain-containing protein [Pseudobdellovibrio sp.]
MTGTDFTIHAGTQFITSEMQEIFEKIIFLVPNWKWLALVVIFIGLGVFKLGFSWVVKKAKRNQHYFLDKSFMQFFLKMEIEKSIGWIATALLGNVLIESLLLTPNLEKYLLILFKVVLAFNLIRMCYLAADAFGKLAQEWASVTETTIDDQLAPLASKTLKVLVVLIGFLIFLQNFGVNVTALLAGLGIGGVALAFAAQDTVANVFGTITIILDSPFKIGDRIKIGDTDGLVEEVGFRSTRIRTFYNSAITIPNSVVAKEKIDNMSDRKGWIRFRHVLGLTYATTPTQINQFIENLKYQLKQDPTVDQSRISISFSAFGDSSLNILVNFHFLMLATEDENVRSSGYIDLIHHLTLQLKLDFAYPTQTMIVQNKG